jgi:Raf kinase inhibitor-like YbhB/YbcL family protein
VTAKVNLGTLTVASPDFAHGQRIPAEHTCDGSGAPPELTWSGVPDGTRSFALVVHDPDAPLINGFVHWVVYNIPAEARELAGATAGKYTVGKSGLGNRRWEPPTPFRGHGTHHYFFHLYALGSEPNLAPEMSSDELLARIEGDVICQARIVGTFDRA